MTGTFEVALHSYSQDELSYLMMSTIKAIEELVWLAAGTKEDISKLFDYKKRIYFFRTDLPMPLRGELLLRYPSRQIIPEPNLSR
jgi:hypothetical protein